MEPASSKLLLVLCDAGRMYNSRGGDTRNNPCTAAILEALLEPGLEVRVFWGKVHDPVLSAAHSGQEPFIHGALSGSTQRDSFSRQARLQIAALPFSSTPRSGLLDAGSHQAGRKHLDSFARISPGISGRRYGPRAYCKVLELHRVEHLSVRI
jgi:hypothetical protein